MEDKGTRRWFWGAAALTTLLVLSVGTIVYQKQKLDQAEALISEAATDVSARADDFAVWMRTRIAELRVIAGTAAVRSGDAETALAYLDEERTRHADKPLLGLIGADDAVIFPDGTSAAAADAATIRNEEGAARLYGPVEGPNGESGLMLAVPYDRADGSYGGAVVRFVPLSWVRETFHTYEPSAERSVYLLAGDAAFLLTEDGILAEDPAVTSLIGERKGQSSGAIRHAGDGEERAILLGTVEGTPWRFAVAVSERSLAASADGGLLRTAAGFALLEAALLLVLFIARRMYMSRFRDLKIRLAQMSHAARHDLLTALPNRLHLRESLNALIRSHSFSGHKLIGLMIIDLDRFKNVNDTLGYNAGDRLLTAAAERIGRVLREGRRLYRLGGDEFVLLFEGLGDAGEGIAEAERILEGLREPISAGNFEYIVTGSAGISFYPLQAASGGELLRNADLAMFSAKKQGGNRLVCYDESMVERTLCEVKIEQLLRKAVADGELTLVYQPIQAIGRGRNGLCAEALLRWHSKDLGPVRPDIFIPIAESTGLIHELGDWAAPGLRPARAVAAQRTADQPRIRQPVRHPARAARIRRQGQGDTGRDGLRAGRPDAGADRKLGHQPDGRDRGDAGQAIGTRHSDRAGRFRHRIFVAVRAQSAQL